MAKRKSAKEKNERTDPVNAEKTGEKKVNKPIPDGPIEMRIGAAPELGQQIFLRKMLKLGKVVRVRAVGARISQAALVVGSVLHEEFGLKPPIPVQCEMLVEQAGEDKAGIRRHFYVTVFVLDGSALKAKDSDGKVTKDA